MLEVGFFDLAPDLSEFALTLFVDLDLSRRGTAGLIQSLAKFSQLAREIILGFFGLRTGLTFMLDFLLEFLQASLQFLDLPLVPVHKKLFILDFGSDGRNLLILAFDGHFEFLVIPFEIRNSFLGQPEVTFDFPFGLLYLTAKLLLAFERILEFIER